MNGTKILPQLFNIANKDSRVQRYSTYHKYYPRLKVHRRARRISSQSV